MPEYIWKTFLSALGVMLVAAGISGYVVDSNADSSHKISVVVAQDE